MFSSFKRIIFYITFFWKTILGNGRIGEGMRKQLRLIIHHHHLLHRFRCRCHCKGLMQKEQIWFFDNTPWGWRWWAWTSRWKQFRTCWSCEGITSLFYLFSRPSLPFHWETAFTWSRGSSVCLRSGVSLLSQNIILSHSCLSQISFLYLFSILVSHKSS